MKFKNFQFQFPSALVVVFVFVLLAMPAAAQKAKAKAAPKKPAPAAETGPLPKVTQVDSVQMLALFKRNEENPKPLLVNFWATWCGPCIEEFPDLVEIDKDYKGKIDFITITLDDLEEIETGVPRFLRQQKAEMPTYLLKTADESEAISAVYSEWQGGLPFTIFFDGKGGVAYSRQGKIVLSTMKAEIEKIINPVKK